MFDSHTEAEAREKILSMVSAYCETFHNQKIPYEKGSRIPFAARVYDNREMTNLVDSALDFWLTAGKYANEFERKMSEYLGLPYVYAVNSGSSANLLAFAALTSPLLGERRIKKGDEIITVAMGFPTTVSPVVQLGCIPIFIDIKIPSYNIDISRLEETLSPKTKAVFMAHTLGNAFDLKTISEFCKKNKLFLLEDNCDALGAEYDLGNGYVKTGTVGDIGTSSFYPAHHITMGEGGAVYTKDPILARALLSLRDWGRDCVCPPGVDDSCGHRFSKQFGDLPMGYDHKYVYSHLGYNLKITEMQAAIGCAQIDKLPGFIEKRRENWQAIRSGLDDLSQWLILPEEEPSSKMSPFGFVITIKENSPLSRNQLAVALEHKGIQTRNIFAGNITKHPCFENMNEGIDYRIIGELTETDKVMNNTLWVGVYPGLSPEQVEAIIIAIKSEFRGV
ncbi:MAG: lipopolysaccharide biosynthesis protein RfbH [Oscillospiraceae bacterium]|nr:lipopolysaccharide biosynthesis protein RfbH [Oscillospiraceae bacterium]